MKTIQNENYGGQYRARNDGQGFDTFFLYNMKDPTHYGSSGDVQDLKTYKTEAMAIRKINNWIDQNV